MTFGINIGPNLDLHVDEASGPVQLGQTATDTSAFRVRHEPDNPMADAKGDAKYPNVNALVEITDFRDAQRSYEGNINVISSTRRMLQRTIDILKS